jgi:hypothetical protein
MRGCVGTAHGLPAGPRQAPAARSACATLPSQLEPFFAAGEPALAALLEPWVTAMGAAARAWQDQVRSPAGPHACGVASLVGCTPIV